MKEYILSLSYGKDSLACLGAIEHLRWPLDRIVTADLWATDEIPAEYPPVVAFKVYVDGYIKRRYGITVEHYCAIRVDGVEKDKVTYNDGFYHILQSGKGAGTIKGFPMLRGPWCQKLKLDAISQAAKAMKASGKDQKIIQYLGIAADEPDRIATHSGRDDVKLPLVELGWEEDLCGLWCKYSGLLSPTYETSTRDGCWFCHNQTVGQLRLLRKNYPELWTMMLKWDSESPVTFHADGHTVHDFDLRFQLEDEGYLVPDDPCFRWEMLKQELNKRLF